jgi:UDP-glucose 4-epimerase
LYQRGLRKFLHFHLVQKSLKIPLQYFPENNIVSRMCVVSCTKEECVMMKRLD